MAVPESPIFTLKTDQARSGGPPPPHFKLKTAQARSGAPHFYARPGARSGGLANFSLCRGTYLPEFGVSTPPPPPAANSAFNFCRKLLPLIFCLISMILQFNEFVQELSLILPHSGGAYRPPPPPLECITGCIRVPILLEKKNFWGVCLGEIFQESPGKRCLS